MTPLKKYIWLVDTIMRAGEKGLTMEQIGDRWDYDDEMHDCGAFAKRSFHRHRNEIEELFGIRIESYNSGHEFRYRIADDGKNSYFRHWMMNSIAVNRIVTDSKEVAQYVSLESYHDEALPTLLQALKEQRMVSFSYNPYWKEEPILYYNFKPHAIKLFERRWYLIGCYGSSKEQRIFALDRISNFELQEDTYRRDPKFDVEKMFDGAFGITVKKELPVESVWLKVDLFQANYLRSLPLHKSQVELKGSADYAMFALRVRPTYDFKQRILSLGNTAEVVKPEWLRTAMREEAKAMFDKYKEEEYE
ncbi:MAG: WYL domain-containing protein [Bacteroidales bacterium]|nr:WYL domain-containing protein [Bacteroidales bacterium]